VAGRQRPCQPDLVGTMCHRDRKPREGVEIGRSRQASFAIETLKGSELGERLAGLSLAGLRGMSWEDHTAGLDGNGEVGWPNP